MTYSVSNLGSNGISTGSGSTIQGDTPYQNANDGIATSSGSNVAGNMSHANSGDGIQATSSSLVQRNTTNENNGFGINNVLDLSPSAYRNNMIRLNQAGAVEDAIELGGNHCSMISPCP